ncbi:MAG: hypothetical protein IPJ90_05630 [Anaerolineaceae bacterium]|nr:hypothetical protein [Anaerolineaceae bacterium]
MWRAVPPPFTDTLGFSKIEKTAVSFREETAVRPYELELSLFFVMVLNGSHCTQCHADGRKHDEPTPR